eukprot:3142942-Prymnesium_polylepis.1
MSRTYVIRAVHALNEPFTHLASVRAPCPTCSHAPTLSRTYVKRAVHAHEAQGRIISKANRTVK